MQGGNAEALRLLLNYPHDAVQDVESVRMLVDEAKQVRRRYEAVRAGTETAPLDGSPPGSWANTWSLPGSNATTGSFAAPNLSDIARGIYAQSLGAGFNRAIYNVQRTVQAAYQQAQFGQQGSGNSGFPPAIDNLRLPPNLERDRRDETTAGGSHVSASGSAAQLAQLRSSNQRMGSTLSDVVSVLEQHFERLNAQQEDMGEDQRNNTSPERRSEGSDRKAADEQKRQLEYLVSLTAIKHVRDVLNGKAAEFDASAIKLDDGAQVDVTPIASQNRRASADMPRTSTEQAGGGALPRPDAPFSARFQRATEPVGHTATNRIGSTSSTGTYDLVQHVRKSRPHPAPVHTGGGDAPRKAIDERLRSVSSLGQKSIRPAAPATTATPTPASTIARPTSTRSTAARRETTSIAAAQQKRQTAEVDDDPLGVGLGG